MPFDINSPFEEDDTLPQFDPNSQFIEEPEEEVGTLQGIANSAQNAFDSSRQALLAVGGVDKDQAEQISKLEYAKQARKVAPDYAEYQKAEGWDAVGAFLKNPVEVTTNIIGEGLAGSLPALGAGVAAGAAGAAVGSVVPGIGTGIGYTAGQVAGTFGGSLSTEYGSKILEELQNSGMDITDPNSIQSYFSDEEKLAPIREKALARGVPVAAFDAVSAGIGGKLGRVFGSEIVKEGEKVIGKKFATKTGEALTELGAQAVLGGGGSVAGSVAAGEEVDLKDVFAEVIGEVGPGAAEVIQGRIADRANQRKLTEAKANQNILNLSETLEQNNAPLTAQVTTQELAKQLADDLNVDREKEAVELADLGGQTLKQINEVKAETQTATTKEEVAANLSDEDLNTREQDAKKLVQQYKDAFFESQDPNDRAKAVEFKGVLDAIQAEKQKRKAAPAEAVTTPITQEVVTPTTTTEIIPLRDTVIQSGIPEEAADIYINNLKNEGINEDQIREIADNNKSLREEAARKNEEESIVKRDLAQRARMGDKEARAQLEGERGILTAPTAEDITAVPPVAEAATLPVEQAPLTQQAVAQQIEKQPYATQEIIQPESVRQEPQDGTQVRKKPETIISDSLRDKEKSVEGLIRDRNSSMGATYPAVFDRIKDLKVAQSVVSDLPIDVVNLFGGKEGASQVLLNNPSVFQDSLAVLGDANIPRLTGDPYIIAVANLRTKLLNSISAGGNKESISALEAANRTLGEVMGTLSLGGRELGGEPLVSSSMVKAAPTAEFGGILPVKSDREALSAEEAILSKSVSIPFDERKVTEKKPESSVSYGLVQTPTAEGLAETPAVAPAPEVAPVPAITEDVSPIASFKNNIKSAGLKYLTYSDFRKAKKTENWENEGGVTIDESYYPTAVVGDTSIAFTTNGLSLFKNRVEVSYEPDVDVNGNNIFTIERIVTPENQRGKGSASNALSEVTKAADKAGLTLQLEPAAVSPLIKKGGKGLTNKQLVDWYKRNGFVQKFDGSDKILIRNPQPSPAPAVSETITPAAPKVAPAEIEAVHFSRTPMKLEKGVDISKIKGAYEEESTFGRGFYAAEKIDESMWREMDRFKLGDFRNEVKISPQNPLIISPETVKKLGYDSIKDRIDKGNYDAIITRGWSEDTGNKISQRIEQLWTPKFPSGKTSGRFTNVEEFRSANEQAIKEITGLSEYDYTNLDKQGWNQNQIFIPPDTAPDIVTPTPAVSETITPAAPKGPQVGQRVRSGSTPQPFVITEVTPQTARDVELEEQYYKIKNERTGEESVVESVDITPIKTTRSSKKLKAVYPSKGVVEPTEAIAGKAGVSNKIDSEYLAAVESGDMETAQSMVDEAAKKEGYDIRGYHGTRSPAGFTEFIPNEALGGAIFISTEPSEAPAFGRVMDVFIKAENVRKGIVRSYDEVRAIAAAKKRGQDAIRVTDGLNAPVNYAVFDPNQIKSADTVTYDNAGNIIPLSQRFNKKTPDIRYARARDKAKYRQKYKSIAIQEKVQNYIKIAQDEMQEAIDNKDIELAENIQKNINTAFQYNINESELYTQEDLVKGVADFFNGSIPDNVIFVEDIGFNGYALYNTETGQIEINRAYFKEGKKIDSIIAHELGHYAFGDPVFRQAILDLWNGLTPQARKAISRFVEKNYSDFDPDSRTEEKIIYGWEQIIAANPEVKSSWDKFVQFVNYYLNKYIFRGQYVPKNSTKVALDVLNSIRQEFINGKSIIREDGSRFTFEARVTEDRSQVHGNVKAGDIISKVPEFFAKTDKIISDDIFDFTQLNQDNTDKAWSIMESLKDQGFARSINEQVMRKMDSSELDEVNRTVGVQRLKNSLKRYGLKLLAAGDPSFNKAYNKLSNKLSNGLLSDTDTNIATTLGAKERIEDQVSGASEAQTKGEKVQTASTLFGTPSPTKEQIDAVETGLDAAETAENLDIDNILDSVVSAESKTGMNIRKDIDATIKKSGVKQKTVDDVIGSTETGKTEFTGVDASTAKASIKKQATSPVDAQAERAIEGLAKLQSDVQDWPNKTQNQVRSIVQQDLRQRPDMGRKDAWKSLLASKLMNAGASESNAMTLSDLVWRQHEINNMNREIKLIESAAENGSLGVIVEMIKNTPLQEQATPEWRKKVIRQYLMSAGLSEKQAESAARLYDNIIAEKIAEAKQKAFEQSISKTSPWKDHMSRNGQLAKDALKKVLNAVRTSALDPTQNTESIIAKQNGWTGFSESDFRRIAEIDEILNDPKTDDLKKSEVMKELNDIISKTKLPVTVKQALAAYYTGQALMGVPTVTVNIFSPLGFSLRNLFTDIARFGLTDPTRIPLAFDTFLESMRSWYNQTKYAFKNEVYPNDVVEYLNGNNVLKELYNKGKKEWKKGNYATGLRDMLIGSTQITGRVLSALDQGAISALENQAVSRYAIEAMSLTNIPRSQRNVAAQKILEAKRNTYASLIASGMEKDRAGVLSDMEMKKEVLYQLSSLGINPEKIQEVIDSSINDALLSVGRNRTISMDGLSNEQKRLSDSGMLSYLPIKFLEQMASNAAQQGPLMQIFSKMLYGFALVPARTFHNAAWYSPYGFLRIFRDKYQKSKGMESSYGLSLGNELQYRQRLTESIAGSVAMIGLAALAASSTDDDDDRKLKIVVTGNGPDAVADKQYYDSWIKKWKPNSVHIVMGDTVIPINIGRGGEAVFFPIMLAGALDDWNIRNKMNKAKKKPADLNQATVMLGSAFLALAQRGPYAAFGKPLFNATRAGQLPEELAAQAGYFGKTFVPVLGTSLARNISDLINDPIDKSSMSGAIYSNIPIVGPMIGTKALNALGQPIRADDWGDRLYKLGVPMVFSFPKNSPENTLNELILSKGDGPAIPTRRNVESKMERPLTNEEFYAYVKTYGDSVSKSMFRHRNSLARMDSSRYQSELEDYSKAANERAARTVKRMSMK